MITRERIKRIFNLEYYGNPEGAGQCGLSEAIDRASDRILAELEPEKVKNDFDMWTEKYRRLYRIYSELGVQKESGSYYHIRIPERFEPLVGTWFGMKVSSYDDGLGEPQVKVGDRVKIVKCRFNDDRHIDKEGNISKINKDGDFVIPLGESGTCYATKVSLVPEQKTLLECYQEVYPTIKNYGDGRWWPKDREAVKNWLASKPKEMTAQQLLAELEKEGKS